MRIDLNSDLGESFGPWRMGDDDALLETVSSVNIACGLHAGDPSTMQRTVAACVARGIAIGAHPGFPDLVGFGRREMQVAPADVEALVLYQVAALAGFARAGGTRLQHVKPHGALYNMACRDRALAEAVVTAVAAFDPTLVLLGLPGSALLAAAADRGLPTAAEGFADRAYLADGTLAARSMAGSVITEPAAVVARAIRMVCDHQVETLDGHVVALDVATICLHGDTPGAAQLARAVRQGLEGAAVRISRLRTTV